MTIFTIEMFDDILHNGTRNGDTVKHSYNEFSVKTNKSKLMVEIDNFIT